MPATQATHSVRSWAQEARGKFDQGQLTAADFDALTQILETTPQPRQRLLYLHTTEPNVCCKVIGHNLIEPDVAYEPQLDPTPEFDWPYWAVLDAVRDGWHIIHFPQMEISAIETGHAGAIGFEFILQKPEVVQ